MAIRNYETLSCTTKARITKVKQTNAWQPGNRPANWRDWRKMMTTCCFAGVCGFDSNPRYEYQSTLKFLIEYLMAE
jgi:hypothetical protein